MSLLIILNILLTLTNSANITCDICKEIVKNIDEFVSENSTIDDISQFATTVCEYSRAGGECHPPYNSWQCEEVCYDAVEMYKYPADAIILSYLDPSIICYNLNISDCPEPIIPNPKPLNTILQDNYIRNNTGIGYFVQIPDIHVDPLIAPYTVANCGEPVCCREHDNNEPYNYTTIKSGKYGIAQLGINCDVSMPVFESMNDFIANNFNLDFIVFVGDGVPHDVYNQSEEEHLSILKNITYQWKQKFNVPVFPILGNHEGQPVNQFEGPPYDGWLNEPMAELWSEWLDNIYTSDDNILPSENMAYGGYYTTLIKPGIRFIGINTGYVQGGNYWREWSHYPDTDMGGQLQWIENVLSQAKKLNELVIWTQHYPMKSFPEPFQTRYYNVYKKYKDIIKIGLFGHSHSNYYNVFGYMPDNSSNSSNFTFGKPWSVYHVAGSVTTYGGRVPAFRVYQYYRNNLTIIDYANYVFDMNASNNANETIWKLGYDFKKEYNMANTSNEAFIELGHKLAYDDNLWKKFETNNYNGLYHKMNRNETVCELLSATDSQKNYCRQYLYPWPDKKV